MHAALHLAAALASAWDTPAWALGVFTLTIAANLAVSVILLLARRTQSSERRLIEAQHAGLIQQLSQVSGALTSLVTRFDAMEREGREDNRRTREILTKLQLNVETRLVALETRLGIDAPGTHRGPALKGGRP